MTSTEVRPTTSRRPPRRRAAVPADPRVLQNAVPATTSVVSTLGEDAIMAGPMQISSTAGSVAMFANPFREEREELVFVDVAGRLRWLTHDDSSEGWQTVALEVSTGVPATADEVVVAVHRDLGVWAFALGGGTTLRAWRLYQQPDGAVGWGRRPDADVVTQSGARGLQVQYLPTRDVMAAVMWLRNDQLNPGRLALDALFPHVNRGAVATDAGDHNGSGVPVPPPGWAAVTVLTNLDPKPLAPTSTIRYGVDGYGSDDRVHLYALDNEQTLWHVAGKWSAHATRSVGVAQGLAGTWSSSDGVGCIVVRHHNPIGHPELNTLTTVWPGEGAHVHAVDSYLDARLEDPVSWTDAEGQQHVYGTVGGTLRVVHQRGLAEKDYVVHPVWDSHPLVVGTGTVDVAVTRPVVPSVDTWAVDPYPDDYPSQHVMHTDAVTAAERCVIYSQDVTTSWWSREVVRLPATTVPYKVTRYTTAVTLTTAAGAVVADYPVSLSSDLPVDLEIGGAFYRCGPNHTVDVHTDAAGQVRAKVVARTLLGNQIHLTAAGLPDGTSFNPATVVHRFFAGTGTLAAFPKGISDVALRDAKKPDQSWTFPVWHQPPNPDKPAPPTAQQVVDWSRLAFSAQEGLELRVATADGGSEAVRELVIQTWDTSRPAYEVVTSDTRQAELAQSRATHPRDAGVWAGGSDDFGDLLEAIGNGAVEVVEVAFDYASRVGRLALKWLDDTRIWIDVLWEQSGGNPITFMTGVFNALETKVEDILTTLQQLFDWDDVIKTRDALLQGLDQLPKATKPTFEQAKQYINGWFAKQEAAVTAYFEDAKTAAKGVTLGNLSVPPPDEVKPPADRLPPPSVYDPAKGVGPDTNWLMNKLLDSADGDMTPALEGDVPPEFLKVVTALEDVFTVLDADGGPAQEFLRAVDDLESLVTNLFDGLDPQSLATLEVVTALDLVKSLIVFALRLADALVVKVIAVIEAVLDCIPAVLEMRFLDDTFLGYIWQFICDELGIDYKSPTVRDVFATAVAYPVTVVSKAVLGQLPFPDGFPDLLASPAERAARAGVTGTPGEWFPDPEAFTGPEGYVVPPTAQLAVQLMVGICQGLFVLVDFYMDKAAFSYDLDLPPETVKDKCFIAFLTIFDMIAFGIGDLPVFWGVPEFWTATSDTSETDRLWWGEYICKMFIYTGDIAVAAIWPFVDTSKWTQWGETLASAQGSAGQAWITGFGVAEWVCSWALWGIALKEGAKPLDHIWFFSQTLSMMSSFTAFMRIPVVFDAQPEVVKPLKYGIDGSGDVVAGLWYVFMSLAVLLEGGPTFGSDDWPKGPVKVGSTVRATLKDTGCQFGPPGWRFDDLDSLPSGDSGFVRADPLGGHNRVVVEITPALPGTYQIPIRETNGYDPNLSNLKTFPLTVDPQLAFRAAATANYRAVTVGSVTVPDTVHTGDLALLFVTTEASSPPSPLPKDGWTLLGQQSSADAAMTTFVFRSVADSPSPGQLVDVTFPLETSADLVLAAWSGVDPTKPIAAIASATDSNRTDHPTPAVAVEPGAPVWVVSFWAVLAPLEVDQWQLPTQVTQRALSLGVGHPVSSVLADSGGTVPVGNTNPLTATTRFATTDATTWSLVLPMAV